MQGLPGSYCGWLLLDALMAALADADSVAGAVHAMRALPPLYSAALLPKVHGAEFCTSLAGGAGLGKSS